VRASSLPSINSWSQAATYQQFFRNIDFSRRGWRAADPS
jgi:hypothetical protein